MKNLKLTRERILFFFCGVLIISFLCWLLGLFLDGRDSAQFSIFAMGTNDFFADFTNTAGYCAYRSPYDNEIYSGLENKQYPPLPYVIFYLFARLSGHMEQYYQDNFFLDMYTEHLFLFLFIVFIIACILFIYEAVRYFVNGGNALKICVALTLIASFPIIYTIERANIIIAAIGFLFIFLFGYDSKNKVMREVAYISLAIAAGLKLTPCIFGILILYKHRWKDAVRTMIYGGICIFLPFLFFKGGFANITLWIRNIGLSSKVYSPLYGGGLIAAFVDLFAQFGLDISVVQMPLLLAINYIVCVVFLVLAYFLSEEWEKVLAVTIVVLAAPGRSGNYDTLYLLPFMVMFFNKERFERKDAVIFLAAFMTLHCFRSAYQVKVVNHHVGLIILTFYLMATGIKMLST